MNIRFTNIVPHKPHTAGKHYSLLPSGEVHKETIGWLAEGCAYVEEVADVGEFCDFLNNDVQPGRNILAYGIPKVEVCSHRGVPLASKRGGANPRNTITRTEDDFRWPDGPGIFAMDYDPREGHVALTRGELWLQICKVIPDITQYDVAWGCSSSSHIFSSATGQRHVGLKGQRLYLAARDARDISRAAAVMQARLWLAGYGYILVSGAGAQLERATTDPCMYQASRLDYAAGAVCGKGLEQRREKFHLISCGDALADTRRLLPDLTSQERFNYLRRVEAAKLATLDKAKAQRNKWADERIREAARSASGSDAAEMVVEEAVRALVKSGQRDRLLNICTDDRPVLPASIVLHLAHGETVRVEQILRDPERYEGVTASDPLEPDYDYGRATAKIYAKSRRIVSHAHGLQRTYVLGTGAEIIKIRAEAARKFLSELKGSRS